MQNPDAPQDAAIRAELLELGFPRDVVYDAYERQQVTFLNSWANYAGQTRPVYPFADALILSHSWRTGNICRWQTALQVDLSEAEETE